MGLTILTMALVLAAIISVAAIGAGAWAKVQKVQCDYHLKRLMIERGMTADEIVRVVSTPMYEEVGTSPPCASEVIVENGGEWCDGLVLARAVDRLLIHFVGTEMSENRWVPADRVRFPREAGSLGGTAPDPTAAAAGVGEWFANHSPSKSEPVDQDF